MRHVHYSLHELPHAGIPLKSHPCLHSKQGCAWCLALWGKLQPEGRLCRLAHSGRSATTPTVATFDLRPACFPLTCSGEPALCRGLVRLDSVAVLWLSGQLCCGAQDP